MKIFSIGVLALLITASLSAPSYAFDDSPPELIAVTISPNSVDITNNSAEVNVSLSASDETGVKNAYLICYTANNVRSLYLDIRPGSDLSSTRAVNSWIGQNLPVISYTGDSRNFTVQFTASVDQGLFPGKNSCYVDIYDTVGPVGHWTGYYDIASFYTIRNGLGYPESNPTPTPSPSPNIPSGGAADPTLSISGVQTVLSTRKAKFSWSRVLLPGSTVRYEYRMSKMNSKKLGAWKNLGSITRFTVKNLTKGGTYRFAIRALTPTSTGKQTIIKIRAR